MEYLLENVPTPPPPFNCSCARCSRWASHDERGVGGCLRVGFPSVGAVNEALAQLGHNVTLGIPEMFSEYLDEFKALNAGSLDAKGFLDKRRA